MNPLRRTALLLVVGLAVLSGAMAEQAGQRPRYARRLDPPMRDDAFKRPRCITADLHTGEIFVCDTREHRVLLFDERGVFRYQINGGSAFRAPMDIAVDPEGYLFLLARHQGKRAVVRLDFDGLFLGVLELQGLPVLEHPLQLLSIALSPSGQRLFLLDAANHLLIIADRRGNVVTTVNLVAEMAEKDAREQLYGHVDVYADTVLVPRPTLGLVHLFDLDGAPRGHVGLFGTGSCHTAFPMAAALDDEGNILVLDQRRMMFLLWDPRENRCLDEYYGLGDFPGALYSPEDLALDGAGRVYIGQTFQGRVQVYDGARPAARP